MKAVEQNLCVMLSFLKKIKYIQLMLVGLLINCILSLISSVQKVQFICTTFGESFSNKAKELKTNTQF